MADKTRKGRPCRKCGTTLKYISSRSCVRCTAARNQLLPAELKEKRLRANNTARCRRKIENPRRAWAQEAIGNAKKRAKREGLPFDITIEDLLARAPYACPALGRVLKYSDGPATWDSASVDKVIPANGYVKSNIQIVSRQANIMKSDATAEQLRRFAAWVLSNG